jgi:23S rRNA (adenine-N6)-dimethyltransferase
VAGNSGPWGFHELSRRWASRLVDLAAVSPGDLVLDVGAGTGVITAALVRAGASVVAIELHPRRATVMRERFAGLPVTVVQADAADLRLPRRPFKVVANPPFNITTALLRRLTAPSSRLLGAAIVLPAWATMRWASGRGVGGTTSKRTFTFASGPKVPAEAFRPPANQNPRVLLVHRAQQR